MLEMYCLLYVWSVGPVGPGGGIYSIIEDVVCKVYLQKTDLEPNNSGYIQFCFSVSGPCRARAILISLFLRYPILHAPMFCHLPQGFQNCFCFCSTTFPSHVGTFFRLQWEFQWENDQNK